MPAIYQHSAVTILVKRASTEKEEPKTKRLEEIFASDGELAESLPGYVARPGQLALADAIRRCIDNGSNGLFEAGTGTGKTLAYLVPAMLHNGPVIISTGTKNLQDQLLGKDAPVARALLPSKKIVLLKGRANYLCPFRLDRHLKTLTSNAASLHQLEEIRRWSYQTRTGDLTEVINLEEQPALQAQVTSTRDNCGGHRCPKFDSCPLYRARAQAHAADIVIVNHHLLFADMALQEENLSGLLPEAAAVIVDEAHQIPEIARTFFGERVGSGQLAGLLKDIRQELQLLGNDDPATATEVDNVERVLQRLTDQFAAEAQSETGSGTGWLNPVARKLVLELDDQLAELRTQLEMVSVRSDFMGQCLVRCNRFSDQFALLSEGEPYDADVEADSTEPVHVHWLETHLRGFVLHLSPLSIARELSDATQDESTSWIFLSATLSVDASFDHFAAELGQQDATMLRCESPFDFESNVKAYLPAGLPLPSHPDHIEKLVQEVRPLLEINPGRAFFLFTSHRALQQAALQLEGLSKPLLVQGQMPKSQLLAEFMSRHGSVLLGTQSFWEGVDVRGASLKLLIIDKLPFPNPSDPLVAGRSRALEAAHENSFAKLMLPETVLSLRQGFGRLIRSEEDHGLFVLGDPRVQQKSYGPFIQSNLPSMPWLSEKAEVVNWLKSLA